MQTRDVPRGELGEAELGYRYGVLFSTEMGLPVYRRLGLAETGTAITRFLWMQR